MLLGMAVRSFALMLVCLPLPLSLMQSSNHDLPLL